MILLGKLMRKSRMMTATAAHWSDVDCVYVSYNLNSLKGAI